jgi:hypothetical protein
MLSGFSIRELNLLYNPSQDGDDGEDELISGIIGGFIDKAQAFASVLTYLQAEESGVEWYKVQVHLSKEGGMSLVYSVRVKL